MLTLTQLLGRQVPILQSWIFDMPACASWCATPVQFVLFSYPEALHHCDNSLIMFDDHSFVWSTFISGRDCKNSKAIVLLLHVLPCLIVDLDLQSTRIVSLHSQQCIHTFCSSTFDVPKLTTLQFKDGIMPFQSVTAQTFENKYHWDSTWSNKRSPWLQPA